MGRILYGVCGSGLGHATRAHSVGGGLLARGHEVLFVTSLGGSIYLKQHFPDRVRDIFGLEITYKQGRALHLRTVFDNCRAALRRLGPTIREVRRLMRSFQPDLVLTDFEPFTANVARALGVPFVSLDNMHLLTHCAVDRLPGHLGDFLAAYFTIRLHYAGARRYLITSFIDAPVRYQPASVVPSVLRPMIYEQNGHPGDYLVAYAGACGSIDRVRAALESFSALPIRAYGFGITGQFGGVTYEPTSAEGFVRDLAGCAGAVATAGHTLVSECLYLGKPMLLTPIAGQFEQMLNAHYVAKLGVGRYVLDLDTEVIGRFVDDLARHQQALGRRPKGTLDDVLDAVEAELP